MKHVTRRFESLDAATRRAMFELLNNHFEGVNAGQFESDMADKSHAVLLHDDAGTLVGFSTFALYTAPGPDDAPASVVCSGDTIVSPHAWGSTQLPSAWVRAVHRLHEQTGNVALYWLLITSGYRTYRFLPVFVKSYYPAVDQDADPAAVAWMHRLATERWGGQYDPRAGVVRLHQPQRLRPRLSGVPAERSRDPHVAFFLERNPGHAEGDELVSLARLDTDNLTRAGLRMLRGGTPTLTHGGTPA